MSDLMTGRAAAAAFAPPSSKADILAYAFGCIISGRPLPEGLQPPAEMVPLPASVEEGIARILAGAARRR